MSVSKLLGRLRFIAALTVAVVMTLLCLQGTASAASYAHERPKVEITEGQVIGQANVNTDCEGTFGCHTYVKIERLADRTETPGSAPWIDAPKWEHVKGFWARDGVNTIKFNIPTASGCYTYRVVVDSYNDVPGNPPIGVSLGKLELSLGDGVKRYHQTYASKLVRHCAYA